MCLINAPADGDTNPHAGNEVEECLENTKVQLRSCGLDLEMIDPAVTTPSGFHTLFPGTGGALYGRASHGWMASFQRSGSRTRIPGLYLAGGSVHPGPGVPMAVLSGKLAAESLASDRASTPRFRPVAISGGMSTA
jgi:1-hydroxycarotenoid 3,4-desaturase